MNNNKQKKKTKFRPNRKKTQQTNVILIHFGISIERIKTSDHNYKRIFILFLLRKKIFHVSYEYLQIWTLNNNMCKTCSKCMQNCIPKWCQSSMQKALVFLRWAPNIFFLFLLLLFCPCMRNDICFSRAPYLINLTFGINQSQWSRCRRHFSTTYRCG